MAEDNLGDEAFGDAIRITSGGDGASTKVQLVCKDKHNKEVLRNIPGVKVLRIVVVGRKSPVLLLMELEAVELNIKGFIDAAALGKNNDEAYAALKTLAMALGIRKP